MTVTEFIEELKKYPSAAEVILAEEGSPDLKPNTMILDGNILWLGAEISQKSNHNDCNARRKL